MRTKSGLSSMKSVKVYEIHVALALSSASHCGDYGHTGRRIKGQNRGLHASEDLVLADRKVSLWHGDLAVWPDDEYGCGPSGMDDKGADRARSDDAHEGPPREDDTAKQHCRLLQKRIMQGINEVICRTF